MAAEVLLVEGAGGASVSMSMDGSSIMASSAMV